MLKDIFYPTQQNTFVWLSSIYLLFLLFLGKVSPLSILFVYFLETIIIGVFNALKMFCSIHFGKSGGYGLILFFLFHYGFFIAIQSIFAFALFSIEGNSIFGEPFNILENYGIILNLADMKYALPAIIFTHVGKFFSDFIQNKKYLKFSATEIMTKPYLRIFVQQFVVIISFFFMVFGKAGIIAAMLLILFRLVIDLVMESVKENSKVLDYLAVKLSNEKASEAEVKKQLTAFTE
jgi:hypothetical protein